MGRPNYVCTICSEHFTRKYSAKRHNITVHNNVGKIVPLVEYLVRRSSGRYQAGDPSWYRRRSEKFIHKFGRAMIADSMGDVFRTEGLQREQQRRALPIPSAVIRGTRAISSAASTVAINTTVISNNARPISGCHVTVSK